MVAAAAGGSRTVGGCIELRRVVSWYRMYCMVGARTKKDVEMKLSQADCRSGEVLYMSSSSTWRCSKPPGVAESNSQKQDRCNVQGVRGEVCSCDS